MPTEPEVFENLGREAVRLIKENEGRSPPDEIRDLSRDTMESLDGLIEEHYITHKRGENE